VTVGPPVDLLDYSAGELEVTRQRKFPENDPDLIKIRTRWQQALRQAVARLPNNKLTTKGDSQDQSIELVEGGEGGAGDAPSPQMAQAPDEGKKAKGKR
jgi:predicted proteasome-type protease